YIPRSGAYSPQRLAQGRRQRGRLPRRAQRCGEDDHDRKHHGLSAAAGWQDYIRWREPNGAAAARTGAPWHRLFAGGLRRFPDRTFRGPAHILHNVSLRVGANEVVCLVGRNGAGKTTTIESIMGFLPLQGGKITFDGESLTGLPPHERARRGIGYSPEDCGVFPELSVSENLMISRWL